MNGLVVTPSQIDYANIITPEAIEKLIVGECVILTGFAKELAPVDTGQLKNSIMWATAEASGGAGSRDLVGPSNAPEIDAPDDSLTGYVGSGLEYAGAVEYGRRDIPNYPRQPYLRPAIDYSKRQRESRRSAVIRVAIKEAYK